MAAAFLAAHGIDLQATMDAAHTSTLQDSQGDDASKQQQPNREDNVRVLRHVFLASAPDTPHDIHISPAGLITAIEPSSSLPDPVESASLEPYAHTLALPSLAHPHLHLDKAHLLTHPTTSHLQPQSGTFKEALSTTAEAKSLYTPASLRERMDALIADALPRAGATHARVFVEVDATVQLAALEAGLEAKERWRQHCALQVCAFAQDPVIGPEGSRQAENRSLMERAVWMSGVECLGVTPYVEDSPQAERECVVWAVRTALGQGLHLDLHLDYHVDAGKEALVWFVLQVLRREQWAERTRARGRKTVCLGHCTRLTIFSKDEWRRLRREIDGLPVYFVGLPTSDLFMMGRPPEPEADDQVEEKELMMLQDRPRCTLQIPAMISYGFNGAIGVNNVGNAFTPYGSGDPLELARWGVGIYQASTVQAAELLYECVSARAKEAIGMAAEPPPAVVAAAGGKGEGEGRSMGVGGGSGRTHLKVGDRADLVLVGKPLLKEKEKARFYRRRRRVCDVVWDAGSDRATIFGGKRVLI